jgi:hypothetical protein
MLLNLRLNTQVQALRAQNAQLAESNAQTRTELQAAASASSMEEAARKQGYVGKNETIYVIIPSPSPTVGAPAGAAGVASGGGGPPPARVASSGPKTASKRHSDVGGVWGTIIKWWRSVWH